MVVISRRRVNSRPWNLSTGLLARRINSHLIPATGTLVLLVVFMASSLWILPDVHHTHSWSYDMDIWNYLQLAHITDIGAYPAIYGQPYIATTPGIVVALAPVWWIVHILGLSVSFSFYLARPTAWLVLGPYEVLLASPALFAFDAVAASLGASKFRRSSVCAVEVYALYNVVTWGHPEDAVAVACLVFACLAAVERRWSRCGWLMGIGVAFQPVILLAVPVMLFSVARSRWAGLLMRTALPSAALLVLPLMLNWHVTVEAFLRQVTYPSLNRPTPWLRLAPPLTHYGYIGASQAVAAVDGPSRLLAVFCALGVGFLFRRAAVKLGPLVAAVALSLSLWWAFETVVAPYYVWPPIAVALIGLSQTGRARSAATVTLALVADLASNADLHAEWVWWIIIVALGGLLLVSWPRAQRESIALVTAEPTDAPPFSLV